LTEFTPVSAFVGGLLIGVSAVLLLWMNGRIAGVSGILWGLLPPARDALWRLLFLAGLVLGALLHRAVADGGAPVALDASWPVVVAGGLLVGFGTLVGGGCTSGHGVCGLGRRSPRALAATAAFMATGAATVFVLRHLVGG